jgi:hypothetical protein
MFLQPTVDDLLRGLLSVGLVLREVDGDGPDAGVVRVRVGEQLGVLQDSEQLPGVAAIDVALVDDIADV